MRTPPSAGLPQVVHARSGALVAAVWVPGGRGGRLPRTREEERGVLARRGAARGARQVSDVRESHAARWGWATFYMLC